MDSVDIGYKNTVQQILACPHVSTVANPLLSDTLNCAIRCPGNVYLVVEEGKIKLLCINCLEVGLKSPHTVHRT